MIISKTLQPLLTIDPISPVLAVKPEKRLPS
jgi:hypothetical protein